MGFEDEHGKWLEHHINRRTGERKSRLERGHGHGERLFLEQVWWPVFGHFKNLHPEYEVSDWRGRPYYIDLVWKPGQVKYAIEIKGYGPHVTHMDRIRYRQELNRETFLQIAGYRVIAVPYDDLEECPDLTRSLIRSLLIPNAAGSTEGSGFSRQEHEVMQILIHWDGVIRPADLVNELGWNRRTVTKCMRSLCDKKKLRPVTAGGSTRVSRYEYIHSYEDNRLW